MKKETAKKRIETSLIKGGFNERTVIEMMEENFEQAWNSFQTINRMREYIITV